MSTQQHVHKCSQWPKKQKQHKCPATDKWINEVYPHDGWSVFRRKKE